MRMRDRSCRFLLVSVVVVVVTVLNFVWIRRVSEDATSTTDAVPAPLPAQTTAPLCQQKQTLSGHSALLNSAELFWAGSNTSAEWEPKLQALTPNDIGNSTVLCLPSRMGRTANWFMQHRNLLFEAVMCGAIAQGSVPGMATFYISGRNLARPHRACRALSANDFFSLERHLSPEEALVFTNWAPLLDRAALLFWHVSGPGAAMGKECPAWVLEEDTLVGHVRSGDIFEARPHPLYGQPPLQYYLQAMSERAWQRVVIFAEDLNNPVASVLQQLASSSAMPKLSVRVERDYNAVLFHWFCARNLVVSRTSALGGLLAGSFNLQSVYTFGGCHDRAFFRDGFAPTVAIRSLPPGDYAQLVMNSWTGNASQRLRMLTHRLPSAAFQLCPHPSPPTRAVLQRRAENASKRPMQ